MKLTKAPSQVLARHFHLWPDKTSGNKVLFICFHEFMHKARHNRVTSISYITTVFTVYTYYQKRFVNKNYTMAAIFKHKLTTKD